MADRLRVGIAVLHGEEKEDDERDDDDGRASPTPNEDVVRKIRKNQLQEQTAYFNNIWIDTDRSIQLYIQQFQFINICLFVRMPCRTEFTLSGHHFHLLQLRLVAQFFNFFSFLLFYFFTI